jgi:Ca-activated chloride channel homolog
MTDGFEDLRAALKAAPKPEQDAKARAMAQAMENFDRLQGSGTMARPNQARPRMAGVLNGVRQMLKSLNTRTALAATTSVAALCLGLIVVLPQVGQMPTVVPSLPLPEMAAPKDTGTTSDQVQQQVTPAPAPKIAAESTDLVRRADVPLTAGKAETRAIEADSANDAFGAGTMGLVAEPAIPSAPAVAPMMDSRRKMAPEPDTEAFANAPANAVKITAEEPVSTFSVDVDSASYAVVRSSLQAGVLPPPDAVRVEELVNYFPYAYPAPDGDQAFRPSITVLPTPWNPGTRLVEVALQGRLPALADRPALNLVFLIDTSGSMEDANKLPLLKQSLRLMLPQLRPEDQVAIVAYAGSAGEVLAPTPASDRTAILDALDRLSAGGSTAGAEGLELAYRVAAKMGGDGAVSRILLATDGDFNVGVADPDGLEAYVARKRASGTYLSVLGFGRGNLDDATMQALAQAGNGQAAYIDTLSEAQKVLVDQLAGALFPIADDVKIQVEWNPAEVAEYRLIGYETRALLREDFNNDRVDAGEIGAGHQVTAIYEVTAPDSAARLNDPLRYQATTEGKSGELGFLRLRWKAPGGTTSSLLETPITARTEDAGTEARFAAAIAGFGQLLRGSAYLGDWGWDDAVALAEGARGDDRFGYRAEALSLMRLAQSLSAQ